MTTVTTPKEDVLFEIEELVKNGVINDEEKQIINLKLQEVYE